MSIHFSTIHPSVNPSSLHPLIPPSSLHHPFIIHPSAIHHVFTVGSLVEHQFVVTLVFSVAATDHHDAVVCRLWGHVTLSRGEVQQQPGVDALQWQSGVVTHGVHSHGIVGLPPEGTEKQHVSEAQSVDQLVLIHQNFTENNILLCKVQRKAWSVII